MLRTPKKDKPVRVTKRRGRPSLGVPGAFATVVAVNRARYDVNGSIIIDPDTGEATPIGIGATGGPVKPKPLKAAFSDSEPKLRHRGIIKNRNSEGAANCGDAAKRAYYRAKKKLKGTPLE